MPKLYRITHNHQITPFDAMAQNDLIDSQKANWRTGKVTCDNN